MAMSSPSSKQSQLLNLPYDIRYCIYQQLFPKGEQIYIQANANNLRCILPEASIVTNVLLVCRDLHIETGEFLYNSYLFNIVGTKADCLALYRPFLRTLRKYARSEVNINAFSNGEHSSTMCISLQAGDAKMGVLNRRRRGEPKTIRELEEEQRTMQSAPHTSSSVVTKGIALSAILCALLAIVLAWRQREVWLH